MVLARRVCCDNAVPSRPVGIDDIGKFILQEDAQVHIGLGYPPKRQLQTPVSTVTNVVGSKPTWHPTPCRSSCTLTYPLPTYAFTSSVLLCLPRLRQPLPSVVPGRVLPTPSGTFCSNPRYCPHSILSSLLCAVHLGMGYSVL